MFKYFKSKTFNFFFLTSKDYFLNLPTFLRNQEQLKIFFLFNFPFNFFMINTGSCVNILNMIMYKIKNEK